MFSIVFFFFLLIVISHSAGIEGMSLKDILHEVTNRWRATVSYRGVDTRQQKIMVMALYIFQAKSV